jgi:signal transduction histidine kinase
MEAKDIAGDGIAEAKASSLLRQVALRVLPSATLVLLLIWVTVGHVSDRVFKAEYDAKLQQQAESQAIVAKTRLETLIKTVKDLARNDLIVNGLIDPDAKNRYLKPFLRSAAIEGFTDLPIVLTDYKGRPIVGRGDDIWALSDLNRWNTTVSRENLALTLSNDGLAVGVPVYIGNLVEGMLVVQLLPEHLDHLLSPIGADGQVELVSTTQKGKGTSEARSAAETKPSAQTVLTLSESNGLKLRSTIPHEGTNSQASYFQGFMLVAFVLDLIALICGIFAAVYLVIRPLKQFILHLQRSEQTKGLELFKEDQGPSEVRQLADAFNRFVLLERELLRERSEQADQLRTALDKEKELSGLQRQFVSMVCHEFRTPLAVVDGNAYRLIRRYQTMPPEKVETALNKIRLSVVRLTDLMESVLSAARLESGTIKFEPKPTDLIKMIEEVVANHQEVNPDYRLRADLEALPPSFIMDAKLMRQVVSNLLSNAIKYSEPGTQIWIEGKAAVDGGFQLSVRDEGVGIPADELDRLFERFFRASTSTGIAGTGIGLHMVKALVDLHGGMIDVASEVGNGTTFSFTLPAPADMVALPEQDQPAAA